MELPNVPLHTEEVEEEVRRGKDEPKESGGCSGDDRGGVPADARPLVGILQMVFNAAVLLMSCVQNSTVTLVQVLFSCICCGNRYPSHYHFFAAHFRVRKHLYVPCPMRRMICPPSRNRRARRALARSYSCVVNCESPWHFFFDFILKAGQQHPATEGTAEIATQTSAANARICGVSPDPVPWSEPLEALVMSRKLNMKT